MRDRRYDLRRKANESVEIHWPEPGGPEIAATGVLKDISRTGARIQMERPIRVQTAIRMAFRDLSLNARVTSCVRVQSTYLLGVEFDTEFQGLSKSPNASPIA
jgi:hypothetical protein